MSVIYFSHHLTFSRLSRSHVSCIMENQTPREILPLFYAEHNLGMDGGQSSPTVKMNLMKGVYFYIPNFDARRKAVLWHDIHHLVTGYSAATFLGECEISAWEIGSGCKKYWAAFLIDSSGVMLGCFINPPRIIQAYARGRRTKNFYHDTYSKEEVLSTSIAEIKKWLFLDKYPKETKPSFKDLVNLGLFLIFASLYSIFAIVIIPFLMFYNFWLMTGIIQGGKQEKFSR